MNTTEALNEKYKLLYLITVNLKGINDEVAVLKYNIFKNVWESLDSKIEIACGDDDYCLGWNERAGLIRYLTSDELLANEILISLKKYNIFNKENIQ